MKRLVLFICTLLCANVLLAQTEFIVGNLKYKVNSSNPTEVSVGKVDETITTANIPATVSYNGTTYSVTSIAMSAFYNCSSLTSVTIPNSVTSIGYRAFEYCSSLTSITIPNSVTSIGEDAFRNCSSLTSITIPNSVTSIGNGAFYLCSSLTSITIGNSVTSIGEWAFCGCSSLTSVTIPNSVTSIGKEAFYFCASLTSVTIPNSVTSIGEGAFQSCSGLTSVTLPENATIDNSAFYYVGTKVVIDSVTYSIPSASLMVGFNTFNVGFTTFYVGDNIYRNPVVNASVSDCDIRKSGEVVIPSSIEINDMEYHVTSIGDNAFIGCSSLTSVTIPNSVTSIGNRAFEGCSSLTSIDIPNSVTSIGNNAFKNCGSLTSITIPNSVTSIGTSAFYGCGLTSVSIPNSVTSIGESAFRECSSLNSVTFGESLAEIGSGAFNDCFFLQNVTCLATTPPTLEDNTVFPYPNIATLTVPCGTLEAYSSPTSFWNMFFAGRISENGYNVEVSVNDETFGSVAVESDCSTGTLTATANEGYRFVIWNDGNTDNPRTVALTSDTSFTAIFALIDESSLLEAEAESISFFPNPTKSEITFSQAIEKVEVIDLTGKTIFTFSNAKTINIESLPSGAYYLRLTNNDKAIMRKVIKE